MKQQIKELEDLCKKFIKAYGKQEKYAVGCFPEDREYLDRKYKKASERVDLAEKNLLEAIGRIYNG
jgi:hypothetical protein